jgi:hypothetical protein
LRSEDFPVVADAFVVLRVCAEAPAGGFAGLASVPVPGVVRPPLAAALPSGRWPEGVFGRLDGVCASAQIVTTLCKMLITKSILKGLNMIAPRGEPWGPLCSKTRLDAESQAADSLPMPQNKADRDDTT